MNILWNSYRLHAAVFVGSLIKKKMKNKNRNFECWFFSRQTNSPDLKRKEKGERSNIAHHNIFYTLTIWPNVGEEKKNTLYCSKILLIRHRDDFIDPPRHDIKRLKPQPVSNIHIPLNIFSWFGFNFKLSHGFGGWQLGYYSGPIITPVFFPHRRIQL